MLGQPLAFAHDRLVVFQCKLQPLFILLEMRKLLALLSDFGDEPAVVPVELQQFFVLGANDFVGLAQCDLKPLDFVFVAPLILIALLLRGVPEVIKGFTGVLVLLFEGSDVRVSLGHLPFQPSRVLGQLGKPDRLLLVLLQGCGVLVGFGMQRDLRALELCAQFTVLPSHLVRCVLLRSQRGVRFLLRLGDRGVGFFVQPRGQPANQVLQRVADRDLTRGAHAFFRFDFLQVAVNGGFRAGVAQRHAYGIDGGVNPLRNQTVARLLDLTLVDAAASHGSVLCLFCTVLHTMYLHTTQTIVMVEVIAKSHMG